MTVSYSVALWRTHGEVIMQSDGYAVSHCNQVAQTAKHVATACMLRIRRRGLCVEVPRSDSGFWLLSAGASGSNRIPAARW